MRRLGIVWDQDDATRLGQTLRRLRSERGLSQETLAHRAGITKNQVQLLEAGRASGSLAKPGMSNPRMATLSGLADALGVTVADLLAAGEA